VREKREIPKKKRERENLSDRESERGKRAREIESSTESSRELEERARDLRKARSSSTPRELGRETPNQGDLGDVCCRRKRIDVRDNETRRRVGLHDVADEVEALVLLHQHHHA